MAKSGLESVEKDIDKLLASCVDDINKELKGCHQTIMKRVQSCAKKPRRSAFRIPQMKKSAKNFPTKSTRW